MYSRLSSLLRSWVAGRLVTSKNCVEQISRRLGQPTLHHSHKSYTSWLFLYATAGI